MILFFKVEISVFAIFGHENCRNCKTFGLWKTVRGCAQAARNDINGPFPLSLACLILLCHHFLESRFVLLCGALSGGWAKLLEKTRAVRRGGGWEKVMWVRLDTYIIRINRSARIGIQFCRLCFFFHFDLLQILLF